MFKTTLQKTLCVFCLVAVTLSSCQKDLTVEPILETNNHSGKAPNLLMSTTPITSDLANSVLMLGINGHMGDAPYLATSPAKQIHLLKERGLTWYRLNIQTMSDGTASASSLLEALQAAATSAGVNILPMLYLRTLNYSDSQSQSYQKGKTLGANFAAKYGKYFTHYNLGNDLELPLLYSNRTGQSQADYNTAKFNVVAAYLKGMDEGIKSKDYDAKTMISAGWLHYGFLRMCEWYGVKFNVVAYNWYSDMEGPAGNSTNNIPDITIKLASLFPNKPIWFTELGFRYNATSSTNETDQNTFVTKFINKCKANPQVKVAMMYELFDEPYKSTQERSYGMLKWATQYTSYRDKILSKTFLLNANY
jgi:hypothetical protein